MIRKIFIALYIWPAHLILSKLEESRDSTQSCRHFKPSDGPMTGEDWKQRTLRFLATEKERIPRDFAKKSLKIHPYEVEMLYSELVSGVEAAESPDGDARRIASTVCKWFQKKRNAQQTSEFDFTI
jgi:hypothetical protein